VLIPSSFRPPASRAGRLLLAALVALATPALARAGDPTVFALKGGTIHTGTGTVIEEGTILLRDGLVERVGRSVEIPVDAVEIDCTGKILYPGFIDTATNLGMPEEKALDDVIPTRDDAASLITSTVLARTRQSNRKGLRPWLDAADWVALDGDGGKKHREAGFTTVLTSPQGQLLAGRSALLNLSGAEPRLALVKTSVAQHGAFRARGEGYPGTTMGYLAYLRQLFLDAAHYERAWAAQKRGESGGRRPPLDRTLEAVVPLLHGEPLVFQASDKGSIRRLLDLAEEFDLEVIVDGGEEAHEMAPLLAARGVTVLLEVDFPDKPKTRADREAEKAAKAAAGKKEGKDEPPSGDDRARGRRGRRGGPGQDPQGRRVEVAPAEETEEAAAAEETEEAEEVQEPVLDQSRTTEEAETPSTEEKADENAEVKPGEEKKPEEKEEEKKEEEDLEPERVLEEKKRLWEQRVKGCAALRDAGVRFAFTTRDLSQPKDILGKVRLAIEHGLSEQAALAALTTVPARILGVDRELGTLEPGKIGNVIVASSTLADEKMNIETVFVDGVRFDIKSTDGGGGKKGNGGTPAEGLDLTGTWTVDTEGPMGSMESTWKLTQSEGSISGTLTSRMGTADISAGSLNGRSLQMTITFDMSGQSIEIDISGEVASDGSSIRGKLKTPFGPESSFTATRTTPGGGGSGCCDEYSCHEEEGR